MRHYFLLALVITGCGGLATAPETDASPPDATPETSETCAGEMMACTANEDCCNRRHSCIRGLCMYSAINHPDTGAADARRVTYEADVQPLLLAKCVECHDDDAGRAAFVRSYAVMMQPATLCPGERVGECVNHALQIQQPEGDRCRTYNKPFHREGWHCLTSNEIDLVAAWVAGGMPER